MARIPVVQSIYGAARQLVTSFSDQAGQFAARRFDRVPIAGDENCRPRDKDFQRRRQPVRKSPRFNVPTTPNPTSGYMEWCRPARLVMLDWTINEAMTFIMSGGAAARRN